MTKDKTIGDIMRRTLYSIFDVETTGLSSKNDRIVQIAAMKVQNEEVLDKLNLYIKVPKELGIDMSITERISGITEEFLEENGIDEYQAYCQFFNFIKGTTLVGHNVSFDIEFIKAMKGRYNNNFDYIYNPVFDTIQFAKLLFPNSKHKLGIVSDMMGIELENAHSADGDVEATYKIWQKILNKL